MIEFVTGTDLASALDIKTNGLDALRAMELGGDGSFWAVPANQIDDARLFAMANPALSRRCAILRVNIPSGLLDGLFESGSIEIIEGQFYRFCPDSLEILNENAVFEIIESFIAE